MLASLVVATIAFWCPLDAVSLMLAFASCVLCYIDKGENNMSSRINQVSQGICETEQLSSGVKNNVEHIAHKSVRFDLPWGSMPHRLTKNPECNSVRDFYFFISFYCLPRIYRANSGKRSEPRDTRFYKIRDTLSLGSYACTSFVDLLYLIRYTETLTGEEVVI